MIKERQKRERRIRKQRNEAKRNLYDILVQYSSGFSNRRLKYIPISSRIKKEPGVNIKK